MSEETAAAALAGTGEPALRLNPQERQPKPSRRSKPTRTHGDAVFDDAKRSISVRISTSDYGRIRVAARHMRMRESEVFRYLVGVGMSRLIKVLEGAPGDDQRYQRLVRVAAEWRRELGITAADSIPLIGCLGGTAPPVLEDADLLLVDLAATRPGEAAALLGLRVGTHVDQVSVIARLGDYFVRKYSGAPNAEGTAG